MKHSHRMLFVRAMATSAIALTAVVTAAPALAQDAATTTADTQIAGGALGPALERFANATGYQLLYPSELVAGKSTGGVSGRYTVQEGLVRLLSGTGLTFRVMDGRTIQIISAGASGGVAGDGERVLGPVRVEGAQGPALPGATAVNGINGSRDVTATEGTGSYTSNALTIGSKVAESIKETPMTVSVLTDQRLKDQAITDFRGAMEQAPGVTVQTSGDSLNPKFYSRGFEITTFQFDGGAALRTVNPDGNAVGRTGFRSLIDMSLYDHVEILRGAAGLFQGYGSPGGVVNLVRKKPLDHDQFGLELEGGSWNKYRVVADATGPLALDGKLRGRIVLTAQTNDHFYDVAKDARKIAYGIVDLDVTPTTRLSVGGSYDALDALPWSSGLMRYSNGDSLNIPRSACLCFDWARVKMRTSEIFSELEQKIGDRWTAKIKAAKYHQKREEVTPYVDGAVDPITHVGSRAFASDYVNNINSQNLLEFTIDGSFDLFGLEQVVSAGANLSKQDTSGSNGGSRYLFPDYPLNFYNVDVFNYDPSGTKISSIPYEKLYVDEGGYTKYVNSFASLDLQIVKGFHVIPSIRYSKSTTRYGLRYYCTSVTEEFRPFCGPGSIGTPFKELPLYGRITKDSSLSWPPSLGLRYDISDQLSAYASYADIFQAQSSYVTRDGTPIDPLTGANFEGGIKWSPNNGRTNFALSGYYTRRTGGALLDCEPTETVCGTNLGDVYGEADYAQEANCCYVNDPSEGIQSYGMDFEVTGEILKNLQIAASYTYNRNENKTLSRAFNRDFPISTITPKNLIKVWMTYRFPSGSPLSGLMIGGGVNAQTASYVSGNRCVESGPSVPGQPTDCLRSEAFDYKDPGRAIFSANMQYAITQNLNLQINLNNIFDKTYYETLGGVDSGNWYGEPRNFSVTLRAKL